MALSEPNYPDRFHPLDPLQTLALAELLPLFEVTGCNYEEGEGKRIFDRARELFPQYLEQLKGEKNNSLAAKYAFCVAAWREIAGKDLQLVNFKTPEIPFNKPAKETTEAVQEPDITPGTSYTLVEHVGIVNNQLVLDLVFTKGAHAPYIFRFVPVGQNANIVQTNIPIATPLAKHTIVAIRDHPEGLKHRQIPGSQAPTRGARVAQWWPKVGQIPYGDALSAEEPTTNQSEQPPSSDPRTWRRL